MALEPADLAGAYLFLSSRTNARGITGTIVTVDAGSMLRLPRPRADQGGDRRRARVDQQAHLHRTGNPRKGTAADLRPLLALPMPRQPDPAAG
jgi:hypothetical protein